MSFQLISENNEFLVYDVNQKKVTYYNWEAILQNKSDNFLRSFSIDSAYAKYVLQLYDDSYLCPLTGDERGYKYFTMSPAGKFKKMVSLLPDIGKEYPTLVSSNLFNYKAEINESRDKIVLSYDHWDRIDIIQNVLKESEITVRGPKYKIPDFVVRGQNMSLVGKNSIYAFWSLCVGAESFIILYSGEDVINKKTKRRNIRKYHKALQFDYNGELLSVFNLEPCVNYITVDWENQIIYGINNDLEPILIEYKF